MPPNPNSLKPADSTDEVICIADQFHFSSFYSSTNLARLEDDDLSVSTAGTPNNHSRRAARSDSVSIIGPEEQVQGDARIKPHTIANPDRVKLKFYSNVLGDNSTFIHYVSSSLTAVECCINMLSSLFYCAHHKYCMYVSIIIYSHHLLPPPSHRENGMVLIKINQELTAWPPRQ